MQKVSTQITWAKKEDVRDILKFIQELAHYEKLSHEVLATEESLLNSLFGEKKSAEVIFFEENNIRVGFAIFFHNYSTFLAKAGIYLEDLYIQESHRGKGYGKQMLAFLAKTAVERGCGRFEWSVLDWNTPSLEFYKLLGAKQMKEWIVHRLTGNELTKLAES